jgi:putative RNA 2'-phosphotransferase
MAELTKNQIKLSRHIALVLRHQPESAGLTLDANGWVPVADLVAALGITRAELDHVVANNDKSRFLIDTGPDGVDRIRASQGHSARVGVDLGLDPAVPPDVLFHGTPQVNAASIGRDGLRPGKRAHVHLSADVPTALRVGGRRSSDVLVLRVDAAAMHAAGLVFHRSDNGVWLTDAVPPIYLEPVSRD